MLWFVEGSGGESHLWVLSRSWLPEERCKAAQSAQIRLDRRFTSSTSLAICCMDTFVSSPSTEFKLMNVSEIN